MKSLLLAGLALALLSQSAAAAEPRLSGMAARILSADWSNSISLDDYLFNPIGLGDAGFALEMSKLSEVADAFGGTIHTTGAHGAPVSWLCYDAADRRTVFVSAETGGDDDAPLVTLIAEETIGQGAADAGCKTVGAALEPEPGNDLPLLGASLADLEQRFGGARPDGKGRLSFTSSSTLGDDGDDWVETKNVFYLLDKGVVTAVAFSQVSEH